MAIIVEVVTEEEATGTPVVTGTSVITVANTAESPVNTVNSATSVVSVAQPGGTVNNIGYGLNFPEAPYEGQVWIKVNN